MADKNLGNFTGNDTDEALTSSVITNDKFFPDLVLLDLKEKYRVDNTFKDELLINEVVNKMIAINAELEKIKITAIKNGYIKLDELPQTMINGKKEKVQLYETAVFASVKAQLCQSLINYDYTKVSDGKKIENLNEQYGVYDREARVALKKLLGKKGTIDCELI